MENVNLLLDDELDTYKYFLASNEFYYAFESENDFSEESSSFSSSAINKYFTDHDNIFLDIAEE